MPSLQDTIDVVGRAAKKVAVVMALGIASGLAPHIEASDPPAWQMAVFEMDAWREFNEGREAA